MKKLIFIALFLLPSLAFASTNDAYVSALNQLIILLTQEVTLLEQQLTTLQQSQVQTNNQLNQIVQNTTPVQSFGSTLPANSQPTMQTFNLTVVPDKEIVPVPTSENNSSRQIKFTITYSSNELIDQTTQVNFHTPAGNSIGQEGTSTDLNIRGQIKDFVRNGGSLSGNTFTFNQGYSSYFVTSGEVETFTVDIGDQTATASFTIQ